MVLKPVTKEKTLNPIRTPLTHPYEHRHVLHKHVYHMHLLHARMILEYARCIKTDNHSPTGYFQMSDNISNADFYSLVAIIIRTGRKSKVF